MSDEETVVTIEDESGAIGERTEQKRKRSVKRMPVSIVKECGKTTLVEWRDGRLKRAYVPTEAVLGSAVDGDVLDAGVNFGAEWEELCERSIITPNEVGDALRAAGFWTSEDIEHAPLRAQAIVNKLIGINVSIMARKARSA